MGIDPGLNKTGWGVVLSQNGQQQYLASGTLTTVTTDMLQVRMHKIFTGLKALIDLYKPDEIALEETYVNSNAKSSLHLAHARAAAILAAAEYDVNVQPYQAKTVKKVVTGSGNADKEQVAKMLRLRISGIDSVKSKDAIDAIALAFCHAQYL